MARKCEIEAMKNILSRSFQLMKTVIKKNKMKIIIFILVNFTLYGVKTFTNLNYLKSIIGIISILINLFYLSIIIDNSIMASNISQESYFSVKPSRKAVRFILQVIKINIVLTVVLIVPVAITMRIFKNDILHFIIVYLSMIICYLIIRGELIDIPFFMQKIQSDSYSRKVTIGKHIIDIMAVIVLVALLYKFAFTGKINNLTVYFFDMILVYIVFPAVFFINVTITEMNVKLHNNRNFIIEVENNDI